METPAETELREGVGRWAAVKRLLKLEATKSITRNLNAEDDAFRAFACGDKPTADNADPMEITAAGNVTVNYAQPNEASSGSQSAAVAPKPKADAGWLPKVLLALSLLGGGTGLGYVIHDVLKPATADIDTDTITELDFPQ